MIIKGIIIKCHKLFIWVVRYKEKDDDDASKISNHYQINNNFMLNRKMDNEREEKKDGEQKRGSKPKRKKMCTEKKKKKLRCGGSLIRRNLNWSYSSIFVRRYFQRQLAIFVLFFRRLCSAY